MTTEEINFKNNMLASKDNYQIEPSVARSMLHLTTGFNTLSLCRHGWMLYHGADQYIGRGLNKYGEFSESEVLLFGLLLRPGDLVVEAGANIGAHTLAMAKMVGEKGLIYAFEPQRLVYQVMVANVAINSLSNVMAMQAGLGKSEGTINVPVLDPAMEHNFGGVSISQHEAGEQVPVRMIDSLSLDRCRLIKADVEGMECDVLEGARDTIMRLRPILYVENDREENSHRLIALIQSYGYRLWWHLPPLYNPDNFRGDKENLFGNILSVNMLCLPQEGEHVVDMHEIRTPEDDWRQAGI